jgi:hypothetical protein
LSSAPSGDASPTWLGWAGRCCGAALAHVYVGTLLHQLLRYLIDIDVPADTGDFRLMDRRVLEVL